MLPRALGVSLIAGRYRVLDSLGPLGRGATGTVYEAIDTRTESLRAVKIVDATANEDDKHRFRQEGLVTGRVESVHVVDVFDRGYDEALGVFFLVMDRLRGEDLGALLAREGRLAIGEALTILEEIARGLDALHEEGVVHRDLKPENIFLAREGDVRRAVIIDLGLAKSFVTSASIARTTRAIGTPVFMSPEQLRGDALVDARADIYAFGHLAFTLLAGTPYFGPEYGRVANLYALLLQVAHGPTEAASERARAAGAELPRGFDAWFAKATHPEPDERFGTAGHAQAGLARALGGDIDPVSSPRSRGALVPSPVTAPRAASPPRGRSLAIAGAALLAICGGLAASGWRGSAAAPAPISPSVDDVGVTHVALQQAPSSASASAVSPLRKPPSEDVPTRARATSARPSHGSATATTPRAAPRPAPKAEAQATELGHDPLESM